MSHAPQPPRWADRLLEWFCAPHLREEVQGDLHERFRRRAERFGAVHARRQYVAEVLGFLRPFFLKRRPNEYPQPLFSHFIMLHNYFKTAWRTLLHNRSYAAINLLGLTLGLGVAIVLFWIVRFESNFDRYHANAGRVYQVQYYSKFGDGVPHAHVPQGVVTALNTKFPGIEKAVNVYQWRQVSVKVDQAVFELKNAFFTPPEFFDMIDVTWMAGSPGQSLSAPGQAVLDEETAALLFKGDALGRTLYYQDMALTVSGIIRKVRPDSEFQLGLVISRATLKVLEREYQNEEYWGGGDSDHQGYVLLKPGASVAAIESGLTKLALQHLKSGESIAASYALHPLTEVHFDNPETYTYLTPKWMLYTLSSIGVFLVLIACVNFINLATVQALKRSREIAVRKVMGSSRGQLMAQFFGETALLVFASLGLGSLLAHRLVHYADQLLNTQVARASLWTPGSVGFILGLGAVVTLLAGLYPALVLSGFEPVRALRNQVTMAGRKRITLRSSLVVAQFVVAQVLVICTLLGTRQVRYFYEKDLGFDKSAIVTVQMPDRGNAVYRERLREQLRQYPEIKDVAFSLTTPSSVGNQWWTSVFHPGLPKGEATFRTQFIDDDYFDFYRIPILAGRNITRNDTTRSDQPGGAGRIDVVINEKAARDLGYRQTSNALGQTLRFNGLQATVVGVAKDYHSQDLKEELKPHVFYYRPGVFQSAAVRIDPHRKAEALQHIGQHWQALFPDHYYAPQFLEDELSSFYENERKLANFLTLLTVVGILIGCLGLFGLVSFVVTQRTKEIGVRKVLGASVGGIVTLLSRDFLKLVVIAFAIAAPIAYYAMNRFLQGYIYKIDVEWWVFGLAGLLSVGVALLTVGFQSIRAALMNPVKSLRSE
jgi:predicted permease